MQVTVDDSRLTTIAQLRAFLKGSQKVAVSFQDSSWPERYEFVEKTIRRFRYDKLRRKDKRIVVGYLKKVTGYKRAQLFRLIERCLLGKLTRSEYHRNSAPHIYSTADIKLLEQTDEFHHRLSERATLEILRREYEVFHNNNFQTISGISHSHITNLRDSPTYKASWINATKGRILPIGITQKPDNLGLPGSIRVDTVHQKDLYHLNCVDEIVQWEIVVCLPDLTNASMLWAVETMIDQFPFVIFNFHSDRGHETINYDVAGLLTQHLILQTKSRPSHTTDNPLVETKNGGIIRKEMGYGYVPKLMAEEINTFYHDWFNPYLNYHRPCGFPDISTDPFGKVTKSYFTYMTPYDKLKSLPTASKCLKKGLTFADLDIIAFQYSDNQFAKLMREQEAKLFAKIHQKARVSNPSP